MYRCVITLLLGLIQATHVFLQRDQLAPQLCLRGVQRVTPKTVTDLTCTLTSVESRCYLEILSSFFQGTHSVALVLLGRVTNAAQDVKVVQAEELERLPVRRTLDLGAPVPVRRPSGVCPG